MARSFVYKRSLDAKILPNAERSNHEFQFIKLLEIKKEVENEPLDMKSAQPSDETTSNSNDIHDDDYRELQSADTSEQFTESNEGPPPKLVIKFSDLWKKSEQKFDFSRKRKRSKDTELENELLALHKIRGNKRRASRLNVSSENRMTRPSLSTRRSLACSRRTKSTSDCSQQKPAFDKEENQGVLNNRRKTPLNRNPPIKCESCGMCFRSSTKLQAHKRYYSADGEFHCTICNMKFSRNYQLSRHIKFTHSSQHNEKYDKFNCQFCIERFERKSTLIAHVMHFHNKLNMVYKNSADANEDLVAIRKKRKLSRRSKRLRKHAVQINSRDDKIPSDNDTDSIEDPSAGSVINLYEKNEHRINEDLIVKQNKHPGCLLTEDNLDLNNKRAVVSSNQDLMNNDHSERMKTAILEKSVEKEVTTQQDILIPINNLTEKPIKLRDVQDTINEATLRSTPELSAKNPEVASSQRPEKERIQMHRRSRRGLAIMSESVQLQSVGFSVDHMRNTDSNGGVSEPHDQPYKPDNVSGSSDASYTADLADENPKIKIANLFRCTRRSTLKATTLNSPIVNITDTATYSNQKLMQNEDLSFYEKSINTAEENYSVNERLRFSPQHQQLEKQVGSVSSDPVTEDPESAGRNVGAEDAVMKCDNFDMDIIQVDDFGEMCKSSFVKIEDGELSDGSCQSISLSMTTSSSNISLPKSLALESRNLTTPNNSNDPNDPKIKDVRVLLVKLENMVNLSFKKNPPRSSPLVDYNLVKTETPYCEPCEEESVDNQELRQYSRCENNDEGGNSNNDTGSIITKKCVTSNKLGEIVSNKNKLRKNRKSVRWNGPVAKKRCLFCDAVFQNNFTAADHYLSLHTKIGALECCLCHSNFKNLRKLRIHMFKHYNEFPSKESPKLCTVCKTELNISSIGGHCSSCNQKIVAKQGHSRGEQSPNIKNLTEHRSEHTKISDNVHAPENRSLFELSSVSMTEERAESDTPVVDRESAKNENKVASPGTTEKIVENFECFACSRVFSESSQLEDHLSTGHADLECCKNNEKCQNVVKPQTLSRLTFRESKYESCKRLKNKNHLPKFSVGKKKIFKSKDIGVHDKFCKKKSHERRKMEFLKINSMNQHFVRQHNFRGNTKTRYHYKCDVCGLNCCCRRNLKIHKTRYLTNGNNVCNICGLTFAWKHLLAIHMKTAHNKKNLFRGRPRCEICNEAFYNNKLLRIHLAHFHNMKFFQCTICRIRFGTLRSLNNHRRYYSKNRSSLCGTCGQSLKCKYTLEYHKAQVHNRESLKAYKYFCDLCGCAFRNELLLQAHIGHFHNIQDSEVEINTINKEVNTVSKQLSESIEDPGQTEIVCTDSNFETNISTIREDVTGIDRDREINEDVAVVGQKIRTHTSSEYKCGICKLSFKDPYAILNHEWEFSNEGTFGCNVCHRKFMTYYLLKNHKIKHFQRNVVRSYECYICKEDFSRADHLNIHGLHLHGPQFVLEKSSETDDIYDKNMSEFQTNRDSHSVLEEYTVDDNYELVAGYRVCQSGKILYFKKIGNNRSPAELLRRHSNEDAYCCNFCQTNFSTAVLLRDHVKKHTYRAYYTNSSRYLCLICKNKFRTNDILRAHVVHCHSSEPKNQNLSGTTNSRTQNDEGQTGIDKDDNEVQIVAKEFPAEYEIQNPSCSSETSHSIQQSTDTPPTKQRKLSNSTSGVTVSIFQVQYRVDDQLKFNDLGGSDDRNSNGLKSVESGFSEISSDSIEPNSTSEEVKLFTTRVEDVTGLQKYMCIVCIVTFDSVVQFKEHFASTHVKNGAYLCTFCDEKFSVMVDLKNHTSRHEKQSKNYICCDEKFLLVTDFARHLLSHEEQTEEKQSEPDTQFSSLVQFEDSSLKDIDDESNVNTTVDPCKCPICDKPFLNIDNMLKHWDSCVDANGLQCDLCGATFKSLDSIRLHKMTYHEGKQNVNTTQNPRGSRVNGDPIIHASTQSSVMNDIKLGTVDKRLKVKARKKSQRTVTSSGKLSKKNELVTFENITKQPLAKILQNVKINNEHHVYEHQKNDATRTGTEFRSNQGKQLPKLRSVQKLLPKMISIENFDKKIHWESNGNSSTTVSTVPRSVNSTIEDHQSDEEVSNDIPSNANRNRSSHHLPDRIVKNVSKQQFTSNDFNLKPQQNEYKEQRLPRSQSNLSSTVKDSSPIQSTSHRALNIGNTRVVSSESGKKPRLNGCEDERPSKVLPSSSNAVENPAYYLCIQPAPDCSDNMNNLPLVPSDSVQKIQFEHGNGTVITNSVPFPLNQPAEARDTVLPNLVPFSLNSGAGTTYYLCLKPIPDKPSKSDTQTVPLNDAKRKSRLNNHSGRNLPTILKKSSTLVPNPIHRGDIPRLPTHSRRKHKRKVELNKLTSQSPSDDIMLIRPPILPPPSTTPPVPSTSTGSKLPTCHKDAMPVRTIPTDKSDSPSKYNKCTRPLIHPPSSPFAPSTSTGSQSPTSHKNTTLDRTIPTDKSASNKELVPTKQVVRCSYCNLLFTEKLKLINHMETHKTDNQCPACGFTFSNERGLQQHLPEHRSSTCTNCNMIVFFSDSVSIRTGAQRYCSVCNTLLPRPTRKHNRSSKNSPRKVMKCGICMDTFGTISEMTVHFKTVHSAFVCGICESRFSTKNRLQNHMQTHGSGSGELPQCETCKKYFIHEIDLAEHALSH